MKPADSRLVRWKGAHTPIITYLTINLESYARSSPASITPSWPFYKICDFHLQRKHSRHCKVAHAQDWKPHSGIGLPYKLSAVLSLGAKTWLTRGSSRTSAGNIFTPHIVNAHLIACYTRTSGQSGRLVGDRGDADIVNEAALAAKKCRALSALKGVSKI